MVTKEQIKQMATTPGVHKIERTEYFTPAVISSFRSRLWQCAKRNGFEVNCNLQDNFFVITTNLR